MSKKHNIQIYETNFQGKLYTTLIVDMVRVSGNKLMPNSELVNDFKNVEMPK